jgi:hypothetical protein
MYYGEERWNVVFGDEGSLGSAHEVSKGRAGEPGVSRGQEGPGGFAQGVHALRRWQPFDPDVSTRRVERGLA